MAHDNITYTDQYCSYPYLVIPAEPKGDNFTRDIGIAKSHGSFCTVRYSDVLGSSYSTFQDLMLLMGLSSFLLTGYGMYRAFHHGVMAQKIMFPLLFTTSCCIVLQSVDPNGYGNILSFPVATMLQSVAVSCLHTVVYMVIALWGTLFMAATRHSDGSVPSTLRLVTGLFTVSSWIVILACDVVVSSSASANHFEVALMKFSFLALMGACGLGYFIWIGVKLQEFMKASPVSTSDSSKYTQEVFRVTAVPSSPSRGSIVPDKKRQEFVVVRTNVLGAVTSSWKVSSRIKRMTIGMCILCVWVIAIELYYTIDIARTGLYVSGWSLYQQCLLSLPKDMPLETCSKKFDSVYFVCIEFLGLIFLTLVLWKKTTSEERDATSFSSSSSENLEECPANRFVAVGRPGALPAEERKERRSPDEELPESEYSTYWSDRRTTPGGPGAKSTKAAIQAL